MRPTLDGRSADLSVVTTQLYCRSKYDSRDCSRSHSRSLDLFYNSSIFRCFLALWMDSGLNHFCFEDIHGCFSDGFLPGNFGREFSLVGSHVVIKRRELSSLEVFQPLSKQAKYGTTCLVLPSKPFGHEFHSAC